MERVFNNRFAQIMELLQQQGLSLSMSSKSGFWDIERNGQYICQISEERLIWERCRRILGKYSKFWRAFEAI